MLELVGKDIKAFITIFHDMEDSKKDSNQASRDES